MNEKKLINYINTEVENPIKIMRISGIHVHEMKRNGLDNVLTSNIEFISGPGCPISITDTRLIDAAIELAKEGKTIVTFPDLARVKGSKECLIDTIKHGSFIKIVQSPLDLFPVIEKNQNIEYVFFGVGFETMAPIIASVVKSVSKLNLKNVSFLVSIKRLNALFKENILEMDKMDGIILPGDIATITGSNYFRFITDDYDVSCSVSGFNSLDILSAIYFLIKHINQSQFINLYANLAKNKGNKKGLQVINDTLQIIDDNWRGIGEVKKSGYKLKKKFERYDAITRYQLRTPKKDSSDLKVCSEVTLGIKKPTECPHFDKKCRPYHSLGPSMTSNLGTCLAYYKYKED